MTVKEAYEKMNGDYEGVVNRLLDDNRVRRFLLKFLNDPSFNDLKKAVEENDSKEAFRAAHTLKGVCQNLGITELFKSSSELTEHLRKGSLAGADDMFLKVSADYADTVSAIDGLKD